MSLTDTIASREPERSAGLWRWVFVAAVLLPLAWAQNATVALVIAHQPRGIPMPAAMDLVANSAKYLYCLPALTAMFAALSWRFSALRRPMGPLGAATGGLVLHLCFAHLLMLPPVLLAAGGLPRRLPDPVREILANTERVELYTIETVPTNERSSTFHGYRILTETNLLAGNAQALAEAFVQSFSTNSAMPAMCFFPGYGMRAHSTAASAELLLCYECSRAQIFCDDDETEVSLPSGTKDLIARHLPTVSP